MSMLLRVYYRIHGYELQCVRWKAAFPSGLLPKLFRKTIIAKKYLSDDVTLEIEGYR